MTSKFGKRHDKKATTPQVVEYITSET